MKEPVIPENLTRYAAANQLKIETRLGFGIHGSVFSALSVGGQVAIKYHVEREPFEREFETYRRLVACEVKSICGFNVPQLLNVDEELRVLEITIVNRPFILDFGGAYPDVKPSFSEEIWAEWEARRKEEYGERWPLVRRILDEFEQMDIYILDVHPSNIAFRE